ncbi:hypothetical protein MNEG_16268 [Monoraphidium neglectum]|uniref:Uncharacterized protein n=1 Tax=Monoraphidium neglectum TaxID=145388 RepID=A0A0D2LNZ9_9CHLO|nr:hypothetical protein MNEG_16268 [Monoraphidium neglectum]KIY91696.1 hypothetical protein MNEG_16268 [Monoraphidium neglectum]|eukprot:XP_013890716.1 hypothetical protein MNEG_16268 [Monoraphidium neglectum]
MVLVSVEVQNPPAEEKASRLLQPATADEGEVGSGGGSGVAGAVATPSVTQLVAGAAVHRAVESIEAAAAGKPASPAVQHAIRYCTPAVRNDVLERVSRVVADGLLGDPSFKAGLLGEEPEPGASGTAGGGGGAAAAAAGAVAQGPAEGAAEGGAGAAAGAAGAVAVGPALQGREAAKAAIGDGCAAFERLLGAMAGPGRVREPAGAAVAARRAAVSDVRLALERLTDIWFEMAQ